MLYLIGIGLSDPKDISVKGLEIVKNCDFIYLESYTSKLSCSVESLEKFYNKKIITADRNLIENNSDEIINNAKNKDVAVLIIGDVFSATTHISLLLEAKKQKIKAKIIHNASILTAIGETGLELYKFGRTASIPFKNEEVKVPIEIYNINQKNNLHTLFLFDLDPINNKFMDFEQAIDFLLKNKINKEIKAIACAALGSDDSSIRYDSLENLKNLKIKKYPQCLIIPAKQLHFVEEEALESYKK